MLVSARGMFGFSNGTLPVERLFAVGGIGSVHGYGFKESGGGTGMTLLNAEYSVSLSEGPVHRHGVSVFAFYDAGRVTTPLGTDDKWLRGVGFGVGSGTVRLEFGFRANDIPQSRQILLRFAPTF
jgi:outer membrane protein assembly factor BamA